MPSQSETRPEGRSEVKFQLDPAPNPNPEKKPDNSDGDPMSAAQVSRSNAPSEECGEPEKCQSRSTRPRPNEDLRNNGASP
jgi:hypothetical protein